MSLTKLMHIKGHLVAILLLYWGECVESVVMVSCDWASYGKLLRFVNAWIAFLVQYMVVIHPLSFARQLLQIPASMLWYDLETWKLSLSFLSTCRLLSWCSFLREQMADELEMLLWIVYLLFCTLYTCRVYLFQELSGKFCELLSSMYYHHYSNCYYYYMSSSMYYHHYYSNCYYYYTLKYLRSLQTYRLWNWFRMMEVHVVQRPLFCGILHYVQIM